ncbi:MAG: serine hydrolase [Clostridia bacterium]|nr:serine hydrolase [Clostridia bacterium]
MKEGFTNFLSSMLPRMMELPGEISVYGKDLVTDEKWAYEADVPLVAASVIKLPILVEAFRQARDGLLAMDEIFSIRPEQKMPSCGALTYLHDGLTVTLRDLCALMIILSDNTATNILIQRLGMENINAGMRKLGLEKSTLRRLLFDSEASARGLENTITAEEMGQLLEMLYKGACVSPAADTEMLGILKDQRLNGKIPFFLHNLKIAHKTGEDDGITHDVGIVYADHPLILCFASNHTDVPAFERFIQDAARDFVGWV